MPVHPISYTDSKTFILDFLLKLQNIGQTALGGTISRQALIAGSNGYNNPGVLAWYCFNYNNTHAGYPPFFMAFEADNVEYDINSPPVDCFNDTLLYSDIFRYTGNVTLSAIDDFLRNQVYIPGNPQQIGNTDADNLKQLFLERFPSGTANTYNDHSCAFFRQDEINDFLNQNNGNYPYVRYMFGYDASATNQEIRLILCPVDNRGYNVVANSIMMQHSWPPYSN